ncbi:ABC transporter substrate binding protein [Clostridium sp. CF012]|uniref:ABC transporter substrate binding protein n=1 Tax=Clostridium sp. CF012 TaxID=2843319 RepID=UPI001C0B4C88|nr:ABC transporter substrate binding protein [Clostridium sp. CF012]MBU3145277.1 EAL domain-containing protein [Clostridium sp. CF012]
MKKRTVLLFFAILIFFNSFYSNAFSSLEHKNRVLFISSYNSSFPVFFQQIDGIKSVLTDEDFIIDLEFMDSKRFFKGENINNFYNLIRYKIKNNPQKYDAIIVGDDNAFDFAMKYENDLFKDIPIVFFGINDIEKSIKSKKNPMFTGVAEAVSVEDTLKVAMKVKPNATKVVAIGDSTETSIQDVKSFYNEQKHFTNLEFSDINLGDLTIDDFKIKLRNIDNNTIVVFIAAFRDLNGNAIDFETGVSFVADNCRQPLFDLYLHGIGNGLLGGKVVSHIEQGKTAAEMVKKILSGTKIAEIPVLEKSPNKYIFDYNQLKKFNIKEDILPVGSILINKEISFYENYKYYIWAISIVFFIMVVFIVYLLINIKFRKKAELGLLEANMELSATYEELEASSEELSAQYDEIQMQDEILVSAKESYRLICEASTGGTWDFNIKTNTSVFTDSWYKEYGFSDGYVFKIKDWVEHIHPEDREIFLNYKRSIKESLQDKHSCEYRIQASNGEYRYFIEKCIVLRDNKNIIQRIAGSHTDITDKKLQELKIEKLAYHDILTGLPNRTYLTKELNSIFINLNKNYFCGAIIFIGLDNFSLINEFFGHETGDKSLIYIGNRFQETFEECDKVFVSKFGGDEYVILIEELIGDADITEYIKKVLEVFEEKVVIEDNELYITISMGIVLFPKDGDTVEQLFKNADAALHKAKELGKNCYKFFDYSMSESIGDKILLQSSIRKALENNEFVLYYQPQIDVITGKLCGYEALIRWISPKHGFVQPDKFIKLSEENGSIVPLGRWVLKQACEFCKKINVNEDDKYVISVNISAIELMQYEFVDKVKDIINKSGVTPELIEIEITESSLMESFDMNIEKLNKLKEFGLSIAMDDFGTGYSSLKYLNLLPIDTLKIDKSFVDDIENSSTNKNFIDIIIVLAHRMGLTVVAEGVETEIQKSVLTTQGCDKIQGYFFSKPLAEPDALEYKKNFK